MHAHKIKNMFVIKNYMHTEHRHTKCMGCLKHIYIYIDIYRYIYIYI